VSVREDELYGPYRGSMGEAAGRVAAALEGEWASLESLHSQPLSATTAEIEASNAMFAENAARWVGGRRIPCVP
jgi:hypothetical protein